MYNGYTEYRHTFQLNLVSINRHYDSTKVKDACISAGLFSGLQRYKLTMQIHYAIHCTNCPERLFTFHLQLKSSRCRRCRLPLFLFSVAYHYFFIFFNHAYNENALAIVNIALLCSLWLCICM